MANLVYLSLASIYGVLVFASLVIAVLKVTKPKKDWSELVNRIKSWWLIITVFVIAMLSPDWLRLTIFAFVSFLALKEFLTLISTRISDAKALMWLYITIPINYYLIGIDWYNLYIIFIPVYAFLFIPMRMVISGNTQGFLHAAASTQWGLMTTVFAISHVVALMLLPETVAAPSNLIINFSQLPNPMLLQDASVGTSLKYQGALLVIYLVILTELNDVAQYLWGKSFGKHKIVPKVSPNKTVEGFLGGMLTTAVIASILGPWFTLMNWWQAFIAGLFIGAAGFCGDVVMSAVKRDLGVKDAGKLLAGHGGILDRLDSLIYTAPLFFHLSKYFFY